MPSFLGGLFFTVQTRLQCSPMTNSIKIQGAPNFRQVSGIKEGLLFRSGELSRLTSLDIELIEKLNIKTIIDFRTPNERKNRLDNIPFETGIRIINIPIFQLSQDITHLQLLWYLLKNASSLDLERYIHDYYKVMAYERCGQIAEAFNLLSNPNNLPAIIHCTVGKDRTGFSTALIQSVVGISQEEILKDYLLTNQLVDKKLQSLKRYLRWISLFRISYEEMEPLFRVKREYLEEVFVELESEYGSIEAYLKKVCHISEATILKVKQIYSR